MLSLWGTARITDELQRWGPDLAKVVEQEQPDVERHFPGIDRTLGPLLLTAATMVVLPWTKPYETNRRSR